MTFESQARPRSETDPGGRSLKTAVGTLRALRALGASAEGLKAEDLAAHLGKSKETARYLLNTLCQEGYAYRERGNGTYRLAAAPPWAEAWGRSKTEGTAIPELLADMVSELYGRTNQRAYLACLEDETTAVLDIRGCQGLPRIPGLSTKIPAEQAHALAVSKALVAMSPELEESLREDGRFKSFTEHTVTDSHAFGLELSRVRRDGFAVDNEEFADNFCCIAAPVFDPAGRMAASLAISVLSHRFATDYPALIDTVVDVAAQASEQWRQRDAEGPRNTSRQT